MIAPWIAVEDFRIVRTAYRKRDGSQPVRIRALLHSMRKSGFVSGHRFSDAEPRPLDRPFRG